MRSTRSIDVLDRHPQPHIPLRRVPRPATFCDQPLLLPHRRIRPSRNDLAMACQAPTVGANVDPQRGTPPLALDPSRKLPFAIAKVVEKLSAREG